MANSEKPKRGRPKREARNETLPPMAFRPSPETRAMIEATADKAGHSLSFEIERRLVQAYADARLRECERDRFFGGRHNFVLAFLLARAAVGVEAKLGSSWQTSPETFQAVILAIFCLLTRVQEEGAWRTAAVESPPAKLRNRSKSPETKPRSDKEDDDELDEGHRNVAVHLVQEIEAMLHFQDSNLFWPLVDEVRDKHHPFASEFMPTRAELRHVFKNAGRMASEQLTLDL